MDLSKDEEVTKEVLEKKFKTKTLDEWMEIFKDLDACVTPVLSLNEAPLFKHNVERKSFVKLEDNSFMPSMSWLSNMNTSERSFAMPKIGQNSRQILAEIGYSKSDIDELFRNKVVEEKSEAKRDGRVSSKI